MPVDYHAWTHRSKEEGGTDPIVVDYPAWIAVFDDLPLGFAYNTAAPAGLQFPYIDWSDNAIASPDAAPASKPFSYTTESGTTKFGKDYAYRPQIMRDGLYVFTLNVVSENVGAAVDYKMKFQLNIGGGDYPGEGTNDNLQKQQDVMTEGFSTAYLYFNTTWIVPYKIAGSPPEDVTVTVTGQRKSAGSDFNITLRNRLWIAYLGPVNKAATSFANSPDPGPLP